MPAEQFRLRTKDDPTGSISIPKMLRASIGHGEFHFMFLVPHFLIPVYGIYRLLYQYGLWPGHLAPIGEVALAGIQGLAFGGLLTFGYLRWCQPGRALMGRREAGTASPGEVRAQKKIQLGFAISAYILFATFIWMILPPAEGPKTAAIKKTARKWGWRDPTAWF